MDRKKQAQIINDHQVNRWSYRTLAKKHGLSLSSMYRMINNKRTKFIHTKEELPVQDEELPDDIGALKEALRKAKLQLELQDLMIDIAGKELGVDIRKKSGTRRS